MSQGSASITTVHFRRLPWVFVFLMSIIVSFFVPTSIVLGQADSVGTPELVGVSCGDISIRKTGRVVPECNTGCNTNNPGTTPQIVAERGACVRNCITAKTKAIQIEFQACNTTTAQASNKEFSCQNAWDHAQNEARNFCEVTANRNTSDSPQIAAPAGSEAIQSEIQKCITKKMGAQETVEDCEKRLSDQNIAGYWTCFVTYEKDGINPSGKNTTCRDYRETRTGGGVSALGSALNAQAACYRKCDDPIFQRVGPGFANPIQCEFIRTIGCKDEYTLDTSITENARLKDQEFQIKELRNLTSKLPRLRGDSIPQVIGSLISVALQVLGSIAFVLFVYGGVLWMVSSGGDKQAKAMKIITWTALGLIVILASYALTDFLVQSFIL